MMKKNGYPCCEQWPSNKMVGLKKKKKIYSTTYKYL